MVIRKGIILAGGMGTRLWPLTHGLNKHLLPVYDKPMIFYPLSTLMLSGIKDILIITSSDFIEQFKNILKDGSQWGVNISYEVQDEPGGLPQAFTIGAKFIGSEPVVLLLGDNIFYGDRFTKILTEEINKFDSGAKIFTYQVKNPSAYGVVVLDEHDNVIGIEEKPEKPKSELAVTGLYFYDNSVVNKVSELAPSKRGELEIADLNNLYLKNNKLKIVELGRGTVWYDAGSINDISYISEYVKIIQNRSRLGMSYPEEVAYRKNYIEHDEFQSLIKNMPHCHYRAYLESILNEKHY